ERAQFVLVERVGEALHRTDVPVGREARRGSGADTLGRRVRRYELRMCSLEFDQRAKETIVLRVADLWFVEHVVTVVGLFEPLAQLFRAIRDRRAQRAGATRSRNSCLRTLPC